MVHRVWSALHRCLLTVRRHEGEQGGGMPVIPALGSLRQEDFEFEDIWGVLQEAASKKNQ